MAHALNRPLKISVVIPYFYPAWQYGGQPRSAFELARSLVRHGHSVKVLTTDSAGNSRLPAGRRNVEGIDVIYYRNIWNRLAFRQRLFWPPGLFRELEHELVGSDVIHIHELRSTLAIPAYRTATKLRLPYVLSTHGGLRKLGKPVLKTAYDFLWGRRILLDAAAVLAVSPLEASDAVSMNVRQDRVQTLPNAISVSDYDPLPTRGMFRKEWKLGNRKTILFLGRLHWIKGADLLIQAFDRLLEKDTDMQLIIAGSDDGQEAMLRDLVRKLSLQEHVIFTGFLSHQAKTEAMVDADLLVVPSHSEVFAINVVEALACGCPVLVSDACGLHPMPGPEQGVRLFRAGSVDHLVEVAYAELQDRMLKLVVTAGKEFVRREFGAERIGAWAEDIYRKVINQPN